jgi:hypothetical protein
MRDRCGFEINEGIYIDYDGFHYYHVKRVPEGFLIREAKEEQYSPLIREFFASSLIRVNRQDELIKLINSVEQENLLAQRQAKCTNLDYAELNHALYQTLKSIKGK